jgi:hypothetical protein
MLATIHLLSPILYKNKFTLNCTARAQTTLLIGVGVRVKETPNIIVDAGDTVICVLVDDMDHSVISFEGSGETFDSSVQT